MAIKVYIHLHKNTIPIIKRNIVPSRYEYFFNTLFIYFPIVKPKNVNEKLTTENTVEDNNKLSVIAFKPNPTEKLSNDTPKAKRNNPNLFRDISLLEGFIYSINICSDINKSIIPNIKSVGIDKNFVISLESMTASSGITKWNIPTVILAFKVFFIDKSYIPITVDTENASILKHTPIINKINSSFIYITILILLFIVV